MVNKVKEFLANKYFKFGFAALVYLLCVIWIGNYWLLLGLPIIYDLYVSRKVNWTFWKKRDGKKKSAIVEWVDAIIFAVVAATLIRMFLIEAYTIPTSSMEKSLLIGDYLFVSKVSYGPKLPNTPIAFPFVHHTLPFSKTAKSMHWVSIFIIFPPPLVAVFCLKPRQVLRCGLAWQCNHAYRLPNRLHGHLAWRSLSAQ